MPASLPLPRPRSVRSAAGPVAGPGRPRPGSLRAVAAAVLVVAATAAGVAAPGPAGAQEGPTAPVADPAPPVTGPAPAPPPTEVPVEVEAATIDRLVAEVVARREAQIASAVQAVQAAEQALAQAASRLAPLQAAADRATTEERTAAREVESWRRRVALFAADAYMRAGTDRDEAVTQLAGSGSSAAEAGHDATRTSVYAGNAVRAARRELDAAVAGLAGAREREQRALDALAVGEADVDAQIAVGDSARTVEATLRAAPLAAPVVAPSGSSGAGRSGPTVLGGSVLGAEELAAFVRDPWSGPSVGRRGGAGRGVHRGRGGRGGPGRPRLGAVDRRDGLVRLRRVHGRPGGPQLRRHRRLRLVFDRVHLPHATARGAGPRCSCCAPTPIRS